MKRGNPSFVKGMGKPPGSGRKKGTPNKTKLLRVADFLAEKSLNPVDEIMALMPDMRPEAQAKVWLELLSYCQAKPKEEVVGEDEGGVPVHLPEAAVAALVKIARGGK
jgi:hypothetical protein